MDTDDLNLVEVYRARNPLQAHIIRLALEQAGIKAEVSGELLAGAAGDLPLGWRTSPQILVEESCAAAAREIIKRADARPPRDSDDDTDDDVAQCLSCGSPMAEGEWKCPICGWSYAGDDGS
jgi:hypothetical protein